MLYDLYIDPSFGGLDLATTEIHDLNFNKLLEIIAKLDAKRMSWSVYPSSCGYDISITDDIWECALDDFDLSAVIFGEPMDFILEDASEEILWLKRHHILEDNL